MAPEGVGVGDLVAAIALDGLRAAGFGVGNVAVLDESLMVRIPTGAPMSSENHGRSFAYRSERPNGSGVGLASGCEIRAMHPSCVYHEDMSKTIQVRKVPDRVHRTLRARAAAVGVSLSDYVLGELVRVAERPPIADVLARAGARSDGVPPDEIVAAVRSGRDRD